MKYVKIKKNSSSENDTTYHPRDSNYGPLETFSLAFDGYPTHEKTLEWLISEEPYYGYNAVYFDRLEHNIIEVGLTWEIGQFNPLSTFYIDRDNFIEVIQMLNHLRKQRHEFIIIEQDENDKINCFPNKSELF